MDWKQRLANLLTIKSLITLILTLGYIVLTLAQMPASQDFVDLYKMVVIFYFGTQSIKEGAKK